MKIQVKLYAKLAQMDENNNFKTVLFDNLEHAIEASEYYYNNRVMTRLQALLQICACWNFSQA